MMEVGTETEEGEDEPIDVERFIRGQARMEAGPALHLERNYDGSVHLN